MKTIFKKDNIFLTIWIGFFIIALIYLLYPKDKKSQTIPQGWKIWSNTGAIYALIPYKNGVLAGGVNGLWYSDGNSTKAFVIKNFPKKVMVRALAKKSNDKLWIGSDKGLSISYKGVAKNYTQKDGMPKPPIQAIALENNKTWVGGESGVIYFKGETPTKESIKRLLPNNKYDIYRISVLYFDRYDKLWIGSNEAPNGGVFMLFKNKLRFWGTKDGLPHSQVTSILEDKQGDIWVGVGFFDRGGVGIFKLKNNRYSIVKVLKKEDLAGAKARTIFQDSRGFYWIGSEKNGLVIRNKKEVVSYLNTKNGLPSKEVTKIVETKDGTIWLATLKGLVNINPSAVLKLEKIMK